MCSAGLIRTMNALQNTSKTSKYLLIFYAGLCVVISLMAPELLMILAPSNYSEGLSAIPPIIGMAFLNALYNVYASIEFYHKKSVGIAVATIIAAALNIGLNAWLIPIYGLSAAAYTTLIANAVLTFCHFIGYRYALKSKTIKNKDLDNKNTEDYNTVETSKDKTTKNVRIFDDLIFLALSIACIAACLACSLLYDIIWVRYVIISVILIALIIKRNTVLNILRNKK